MTDLELWVCRSGGLKMANGLLEAALTSARILRRYSASAELGLGGLGDLERWTVGNSDGTAGAI